MLDHIREQIMELGLSTTYLGFEYMARAISMIQKEDGPIQMKVLYLEISKSCGTNPKCVERDIRTATEAIWRNRDWNGMPRICGKVPVKPPSNAQILNSLAICFANSTKKCDIKRENW